MDTRSDPFVDHQLAQYMAGMLSLAALFDPASGVQPDHPGIMRVKRLRLHLQLNPALKDDPMHQRLLKRVQNRAVTAYRQQREHPGAWGQYVAELAKVHGMVKWANVLAPADDAAITEVMAQVPSPLSGTFVPAPPPLSAWGQLCALADREFKGKGVGRSSTVMDRASHAVQMRDDRETERARKHRDALVLMVVRGELPSGAITIAAPHLTWCERVIADQQMCLRLGRPVPAAVGHTLADVPLHMRGEP